MIKKVDDFEYILPEKGKIIGLIVEDEENYSFLIKSKEGVSQNFSPLPYN